MEMPIDIINKHASPAFGLVGGDGLTTGQRNLNIDLELQRKFIFIPQEEIDAIEIEHTNLLSAGTGPENCQAGESENPNWLYNHALNALALWKHLKERERLEEEQREIERNRQVIINRRPQPGVYQLNTGRQTIYVVAVTADRRIIDLNKTGKHTDFTDVFDGLDNKAQWTFNPIETGLSA